MIKWWELQKVVKIYLEEMMQHEEDLHESGGMNGTESFKEYAITAADNTERCVLRLKEYHDSKECTYEIVTKECSIIKIKKTPNTIFSVLIDNEDGLINITDFTMEDISRLGDMITDYVNTIKNYDEKHPKFEIPIESTKIQMLGYDIDERMNITITFLSNNRPISRKGLYVGFMGADGDNPPRAYLFKVTKKKVYFESLSLINDNRVGYEAKFHGYYKPEEAAVMIANFRWVCDDELIKQANREACYT